MVYCVVKCGGVRKILYICNDFLLQWQWLAIKCKKRQHEGLTLGVTPKGFEPSS